MFLLLFLLCLFFNLVPRSCQSKFIPIDFSAQIIPGTFEHALAHIFDNQLDLSGLPFCQASCRRQYSKRLGAIEPVFGNITVNKGMNKFTLRGQEKVNTQWQMYCLVHNIEKLRNSLH
nr:MULTISPECIES: transposase [Colwellia]